MRRFKISVLLVLTLLVSSVVLAQKPKIRILATGGTMKAACDLVKKFNPKKIYCNFIIELASEFPESRSRFDQDIEITSLLKF